LLLFSPVATRFGAGRRPPPNRGTLGHPIVSQESVHQQFAGWCKVWKRETSLRVNGTIPLSGACRAEEHSTWAPVPYDSAPTPTVVATIQLPAKEAKWRCKCKKTGRDLRGAQQRRPRVPDHANRIQEGGGGLKAFASAHIPSRAGENETPQGLMEQTVVSSDQTNVVVLFCLGCERRHRFERGDRVWHERKPVAVLCRTNDAVCSCLVG
jgi:hypothetical protein